MTASEKSTSQSSTIPHQLIAEVPVERLLFEPHNKIYTRKVKGFYQRLRRYTGIPLLMAYFLTPWFSINGRPAMLFDLTAQQFHILWMTFWPQDAIFLSWLLMIAAFMLFTATVLVGRVWCGFSCPQTVWTMMFIWVENKCEGDRNQRIKLDDAPWSVGKLLKKSVKHSLWLAISLVTGITFIAYFYGIQSLYVDLFTLEAPLETYFWVGLFVALTYINAGWLRDQVCKHMCPYARFQSVMYDNDTLLVSYDSARGEPRSQRGTSEATGDCIDCQWCVQVCPVDIDIRDGLQYECIDCGLCADACDGVMDKLNKPRGLVGFTSQQALQSGKQHFFRPRFIGYALSVVVIIGLFMFSLATRDVVSIDVVRDRTGELFHRTEQGLENVYTVKINNHSGQQQDFRLSVTGNDDYFIKGITRVQVEAGEVYAVALRVGLDHQQVKKTSQAIQFHIQALGDERLVAEQASRFIGPVK